VRTGLGGSIVVSKKGKAQERRYERIRKPISNWISPIMMVAWLVVVSETASPYSYDNHRHSSTNQTC
jgi:hypothetical protein